MEECYEEKRKLASDMKNEDGTDSETKLSVYLQLRRFICRIDICAPLEESLPTKIIPSTSVKQVMDFLESGIPFGTGSFILGERLHLVGGEKVSVTEEYDEPTIYANGGRFDYAMDDSDGGNGLNTKVYTIQLDTFKPIKDSADEISCMQGGKTIPQVAVIDNKVYALSSCPGHFYKDQVPKPAFECLDIAAKSWDVLPEPPKYRHEEWIERVKAAYIAHHLVIGHKIYVKTPNGYFSYDVKSQEEWKDARSFVLQHDSVPCPLDWPGGIAEGEDGLVIAYTEAGLVAYQYDSDGNLLRHQILHDLNLQFPLGHRRIGYICNLGNGEFCYVISGYDDGCGWTIYCSSFLVGLKSSPQSAEKDFLTILAARACHQYYFCPTVIPADVVFDDFTIHNVFTFDPFRKHALKHSELNRSFKKPKN